MKQRTYIETTIVSYYASRPSRDVVVAGRQVTTRDLWPAIVAEFDCFVSALVLQEAGAGDPQAAAARLQAIEQMPVLQIDHAAERLAAALLADGPVPEQQPEDALHIALAAAGGMDYLLTWNLGYIHNVQLELLIRRTVERHGYVCPVFCSPDELMGDRQ